MMFFRVRPVHKSTLNLKSRVKLQIPQPWPSFHIEEVEVTQDLPQRNINFKLSSPFSKLMDSWNPNKECWYDQRTINQLINKMFINTWVIQTIFSRQKINNSVSAKLLHLLWGIWKCNSKHCQRHHGPRRWLLWPVILVDRFGSVCLVD